MFTPQQIQEQTFTKAVFGGYDMEQVDEFLEPLSNDYITLYKENSVLKAKMKVLVEKLEEYRAQEAAIGKALTDAKAKSEQMIREAEARCAAMTQNQPTAGSPAVQAEIDDEHTRLDYAKRTALSFIEVVEKDIKGHLKLLEELKSRDLTLERRPAPAAIREKPYDWQADSLVVDSAKADTTESIASEISENLEKLISDELDADAEPELSVQTVKPVHPESATIKFEDLKFGRNYDPNGKK